MSLQHLRFKIAASLGPFSPTVIPAFAGSPSASPPFNSSPFVGTVAGSSFQACQSQSVSFTQPPDAVLGSNNVSLSATSSSGLPVVFGSASADVCSVSGSHVTLVSAGTCRINASASSGLAADIGYNAAPVVSRSFLVTVPQINFPKPADAIFGSGDVTLTATATSGLPVSYASNTASICTVSRSSVSLVAAGTCSITATQPGDSQFPAAAPVTQTFVINRASQKITFAVLSDVTFDKAPLTISATASSGLPVSFSSGDTSVCTLADTVVSFVAVGTCPVVANQQGNSNYTAAPPVTRAFAIGLGHQTIAFLQPPNTTFGASPAPLSATASSGLPVTFTSTSDRCGISGSVATLQAVNVLWSQVRPAMRATKLRPTSPVHF